MRVFNLFLITTLLFISYVSSYSQTCDATVSGSQNWSALSWSCSGASAPVTDGNIYTEDVTINGLGNGEVLTANITVTIDGNVTINASGAEPAFTVSSGVTLHITGNLNSDNNKVLYTINGTLQVDGTFTVKNGNQFAGSGTLSGGTLVVKNQNTCAGTCPTISFTTCCENGGSDCFPPSAANDFCTNNDPNALPVELLYIKALVAQSDVLLKWATIQEKDNKHFIIQRSQDLFNWHNIDTVQGKGTHVGLLHYSMVDKSVANGHYYYRLLQQDFDGTTAKSPVVSVWLGTSAPQVSVYPNPAVDNLNLQLSAISGDVKLSLVSLLGKTVWQDNLFVENGGFLFKSINISSLPGGVYVLKITTRQQLWQKKVIIK